MQIKTEIIFDSGAADFTFSLQSRKYIELNGEKQYVGEPHRMAVTPLDLEQVRQFVSEQDTIVDSSTGVASFAAANINIEEHPIVKILKTIWTEETQAAYKSKFEQEAQEPEEDERRRSGRL